ncbi:MAG: hypothetical protein ACOCWM_05050 [Cyclobacteriaceae bacterium]
METLIFVQHMFETLDQSEAVLTQLEKEGWELHKQMIMHRTGCRLVMKRNISKIMGE